MRRKCICNLNSFLTPEAFTFLVPYTRRPLPPLFWWRLLVQMTLSYLKLGLLYFPEIECASNWKFPHILPFVTFTLALRSLYDIRYWGNEGVTVRADILEVWSIPHGGQINNSCLQAFATLPAASRKFMSQKWPCWFTDANCLPSNIRDHLYIFYFWDILI